MFLKPEYNSSACQWDGNLHNHPNLTSKVEYSLADVYSISICIVVRYKHF